MRHIETPTFFRNVLLNEGLLRPLAEAARTRRRAGSGEYGRQGDAGDRQGSRHGLLGAEIVDSRGSHTVDRAQNRPENGARRPPGHV